MILYEKLVYEVWVPHMEGKCKAMRQAFHFNENTDTYIDVEAYGIFNI